MREKIGLCTKKGFHIVLVFALVVGMFGTFYPAKTAQAKTVSAIRTTTMYADGRYIYYTGDWGVGPLDGIRCLDTKTGKIKKIYKDTLSDGSDITDLVVKGNYIYFSRLDSNKSGYWVYYVYRIQKNGKNLKKLALGRDIKLVGNRIYYTKCKKTKYDMEPVNEASMKLDGSDKRNEKGMKYSWKASSPDRCSKSYDVKEITVTSGNYYYYLKNNSRTLMRMNLNTGKTKKLYTGGRNTEIYQIIAHKTDVCFYVLNKKNQTLKKYYINADGKKILLHSNMGFAG